MHAILGPGGTGIRDPASRLPPALALLDNPATPAVSSPQGEGRQYPQEVSTWRQCTFAGVFGGASSLAREGPCGRASKPRRSGKLGADSGSWKLRRPEASVRRPRKRRGTQRPLSYSATIGPMGLAIPRKLKVECASSRNTSVAGNWLTWTQRQSWGRSAADSVRAERPPR
jgi:hypothetical protein